MLQASDEFWADEHETFVDMAAQDTMESALMDEWNADPAEREAVYAAVKGETVEEEQNR